MKTTLTKADLHQSVIAVPPLCRDAELRPVAAENTRLVRHLEAGGVTTLLYGGNANFYNIALSEYGAVLDQLEAAAGPETLIIPAIGPYYGVAMDQVAILANRRFPTAMLLPTLAVSSPEGVQQAVLRLAGKLGRPIVLYIKDAGYVTTEVVKMLVAAGVISWIKYAVVRADPAEDELLARLVDCVDPEMIVSGIGEQPAIVHWRKFGVQAFTSGCVCVAPRRSQAMLRALQGGDFVTADALRQGFNTLETLRNDHGPIPVLHHAVAAAGIAETGPALPLLRELAPEIESRVATAAKATLSWDSAA